jgi:DNA-binding NarL/FixJ family response regulator
MRQTRETTTPSRTAGKYLPLRAGRTRAATDTISLMRRIKRAAPTPLRVVIADDHMLLPEAVRVLLEPHPDIEIAGVVYEAGHILARVAELEPDLLLLDSQMPGMDGLAFVDRLRVAQPGVAVVLLTESPDPELARAAFERGAKGVILKGSDPAKLAPALRAAIRGEKPRNELRVAARSAPRRVARDGIAARLDALRALVDRAIFGHDYDWL